MDVSLAKFIESRVSPGDATRYRLLFDISKEVFLKHVVFLYQELLYPLWLRDREIELFSFPFDHQEVSISPQAIHCNPDVIVWHLYLEAFLTLPRVKREELSRCKKYSLENLSEEQRKALKTLDGPISLVASAGSGKTKTLVNRIFHLLNEGVGEEHLLVLVFNKKAEEEIKERLASPLVEVRTFHSFSYQLLKEYTDYIFDETLMEDVVGTLLEKAVLKYHKLIYKNEKEPLKKYREMLSLVKNRLLSKEEMILDIDYEKVDFYPIFLEYLHLQEEDKICDYDDMLYLAYCLLLKNGMLRRKIQERYHYILVDEFQDCNPLQLAYLELLSLPRQNLFVVGDDDQMIYGFRGATASSILNFSKKYPTAKQLFLSTNYRSAKRIVYHSNLLIHHNLVRTQKEMRAYQTELGEFDIYRGKTLLEECEEVYRFLKRLPDGTVAVLYRYHAHGSFLRLYLELKGVVPQEGGEDSYKLVWFFFSLFIEKETKFKGRELCSLLGIPWKNDYHVLSILFQELDARGYHYQLVGSLLQKKDLAFPQFCYLLKLSPELLFPRTDIPCGELFSFVSELVNTRGGVKSFYQLYHLKKKELPLQRDILLSTIHKTKGNEFDFVCYFHMEQEEGLLSEDERRVSYVAMTRAKKKLLITMNALSKNNLSEILKNERFQSFEKSDLLLEKEQRAEQLFYWKKQLCLEKKDQKSIQKCFSYEIREEVKSFYHHQKHELRGLEKKIRKEEDQLFLVEEELWGRALFSPKSYDIIKEQKGSEEV